MAYFQYPDVGFVAAPLLHVRVKYFIDCGNQLCCDPRNVQIESVWFHIVPNASVGKGIYYI